jgi:hypothetical protein
MVIDVQPTFRNVDDNANPGCYGDRGWRLKISRPTSESRVQGKMDTDQRYSRSAAKQCHSGGTEQRAMRSCINLSACNYSSSYSPKYYR